LTLLGWRQAPEPVDGGVPQEVAGVLARAITSTARVTFPCTFVSTAVANAWSPMGDDLIRSIIGKGFGARLVAKVKGKPSAITLMSTRRPETALRLFDDAGFPWWMQGQVVVLSTTDAPPPNIDEDTLLALFGDDWANHAPSLGPLGIEGIVRPGVDGDVAGLLSLTDAFDDAVIDALESETRRAGFDWGVLTEDAFARL
jgi:hypothetical protein